MTLGKHEQQARAGRAPSGMAQTVRAWVLLAVAVAAVLGVLVWLG